MPKCTKPKICSFISNCPPLLKPTSIILVKNNNRNSIISHMHHKLLQSTKCNNIHQPPRPRNYDQLMSSYKIEVYVCLRERKTMYWKTREGFWVLTHSEWNQLVFSSQFKQLPHQDRIKAVFWPHPQHIRLYPEFKTFFNIILGFVDNI